MLTYPVLFMQKIKYKIRTQPCFKMLQITTIKRQNCDKKTKKSENKMATAFLRADQNGAKILTTWSAQATAQDRGRIDSKKDNHENLEKVVLFL